MAHLSLSLLGAPVVRHAGAQVPFATRKAVALLVYLAVESGSHTRDKLTALLWPDSDRQRGRAALRYTLASLRSALGEAPESGHLQVSRDAIGFDASSDFDLDLRGFEEASSAAHLAGDGAESPASRQARVTAMAKAAARWRGEFMEGFSLPDAPGFDDWATVQGERWHRRAELLFERLAQAQAGAGARSEAVETAARWVTMSPLNEAGYRQLMQLHLASGELAAALRVHQTCRTLLERHLGTGPDPQTEALAERIRTAQPSSLPGVRSVSATPLLEGPLVGRSEEMVHLVELYHSARQGQGRVAVVLGEAGIGKTRLAREFIGWAQGQGADVLTGRAFEAGGRLPYQPVVDALRPRLEGENAPEDLLGDVWLAELSRLLPELLERYRDLPPPSADEATARTRLYEAAARLVQALAERSPVVMLVDDVQWADPASLDLLQYAARRWAESRSRVLLLLGLRSETLAERPELGDWLIGLRRQSDVVDLELGPLSLAGTNDLLERLAAAGGGAVDQPIQVDAGVIAGFSSWLFEETGGQPFFIIEMLRALVEMGVLARRADHPSALDLQAVDGPPASLRGFLPPGVRSVVSARVGRLSADGRALLWAGAVLGEEFTFEQLCRVAGLSEGAGLTALDAAEGAHLLRGSVGGRYSSYGFTHDKIREVVDAEAGEARRRVYHRRAFETLSGSAPAADLARHAIAAGLAEPAVRFSLQAGDTAMRLLAARDAIAHYERAMRIAEEQGWTDAIAEALGRRGRAFASLALWADAKRDLDSALATVGADATEPRAELLVGLAEACFWLMDIPRVHHHASEAVELGGRVGRDDLVMTARGWRGAAHGADGRLDAGVAEFQHAVSRARELAVPPPANVLTLHGLTLYWLGQLDEAMVVSRAGTEAARAANDASVLMYSLPHLGMSLAARGRYGEAVDVFAEARRFGQEYRIHNLLSRAIAISTGFRMELGDYSGAEELSTEARDIALSASWPPTAASASIDLLFNFIWRGEIGKAERLLAEVSEAVETAVGFHGWLWRLRLAEARAEIAAKRGGWEEAARLASLAIDQSRARRRRKYEVIGLTTRGSSLAALGQTSAAATDLRAAMTGARSIGDPLLFLRVAGTLLAVAGDTELANEAQAVADRVTEALPEGQLRRSFAGSPPMKALADALEKLS